MGCGASIPSEPLHRRPNAVSRAEHSKRESARRAQHRLDEADRYFCDATFHFHHFDFTKTVAKCSSAIATEPNHARAILLRCVANRNLKKWNAALDDATAAIGLGHKEAHRERGCVYFESRNVARRAAELESGWEVRASLEGGLDAGKNLKRMEGKISGRSDLPGGKDSGEKETADSGTNASTRSDTNASRCDSDNDTPNTLDSETLLRKLTMDTLDSETLTLALSDLNVALRIDSNDLKALTLRAEVFAKSGDAKRAARDDRLIKKINRHNATEKNNKEKLLNSEEIAIDDSGELCVVCIDSPRNTRLSPCQHSALCGECAKTCRDRHGSCPICNQKIVGIEWGSFQRTFAPAEVRLAMAKMASAVKKAREDDEGDEKNENWSSAFGTMPTLTPTAFDVGGRSGASTESSTDRCPRPRTPDFSEYTVGDGMEDDLEVLVTPVCRNGACGVFSQLLATPVSGTGSGIFEQLPSGFGVANSPTPMGGARVGNDESDLDSETSEPENDDGPDGPDTPPRDERLSV